MKNFCGLIWTKVVAILGGRGKIWKILRILKYCYFWQKANIENMLLIWILAQNFHFPWHFETERWPNMIFSQKQNFFLTKFKLKACSQYFLEDRRGWPWPPWLFLSCLLVIWSNFCFENILGLCCYLDQDCRGPPAPNGVVDDRRGWPWPPWWFLTCFVVIWSNFCLQNIAQKGFI